ncbi:hypothetical protein ACFQ1E_20315 [Sphingomonas canadensis]|uniref:CHASE domain-containing protein n=1 Tax=Sphingomonas canadensis TaxID=1219257 RepID=A0ABW3HG56_9SPHN|nr:hypothetical protein [Sphingomonas canadensis]MCW3838397.1 hypothetical protein [Sphingomonas canadensis]
MTEFYAELKGWQTAIGATLGFVALVVGALVNFHLNRRRDQRLRNEEIASTALALYGEILLLRESTARLAQFVGARYLRSGFQGGEDDFDRYFREMVEIPAPRLFPALAPKIGLLPPSIALEVSKFYFRIEEAQTWLPRLEENPDRKYSYSVAHVLQPAVDAVDLVESALREIEELTGIEPAKLSLDIGKAKSALSMEDDFHAEQAASSGAS